MNKEEKEAIKSLKNIAENAVEYDYLKWEEIDAVKTILNLIQKHEAIIDKMAEQLTTPINSKEWIIELYKKEVEKDVKD